MDDNTSVVLDVGAHTTKVGFSGDNLPREVIQSVVAHHKADYSLTKVGTEALISRRTHKLYRPLSYSSVANWDDLEQLWRYSLESTIRVDPSRHPVLLTEHHGEHPRCREKKTEIFFETMGVPQFTLCCQSILGLYSKGKSAGSVVDIGDGHAIFLPVIDGRSLSDYSINLPGMTGQDVTHSVLNKLKPFGFRETEIHNELSRHIKESSCRVSGRSGETAGETVKYRLPDDTLITLESSRICLDGIYFGSTCQIHMAIDEVFHRFDTHENPFFSELTRNVVLCGGGVRLSGFKERLQCELSQLGQYTICNDNVSNPRFYAWIGGSILSSLSTFPRISISRMDYNEYGSSLVNSRCVSETNTDTLYGIYPFKGG